MIKKFFPIKVLLSCSIGLLLPMTGLCFTYGEHKWIGDTAFVKFLSGIKANHEADFFIKSLSLSTDGGYFSFLNRDGDNHISYGVLNGLSGDHESNPLLLQEQLNNKESVIQRIMTLHEEYIKKGFTAAPDGKLVSLDFRYALLAAVNMSHFYIYGKDFESQLKAFDPELIKLAYDPVKSIAVFKKLGKTNALTMYLTMHLLAMDLARQAGNLKVLHPEQAEVLIRHAILFNSFGDHFLEDAFSAGHLVVNRSIFASFTNNKALHDFYSQHGTMVVNRNGEIWKAYGDGALQKSQPDRIVQAVYFSLQEVFDAYNNGFQVAMDPGSLIGSIKPLALIPIPYGSDAKDNLPDNLLTADAQKATQILPQRNFIRSRIGNSFVFGFNNRTFSKYYLNGGEFRLNFGLFSKRYEYNDSGGKQGMLDRWHGYTVSYGFGNTGLYESDVPKTAMHLLKGGIRSNFDYWITDKRFLGITSYMEAGLQFTDLRTSLVLVPSVGLQLGPLLNVNYYNMPTWLRIPAQFFLPLEIRIGSVLNGRGKPVYFSGADLTYAF